MSTNVVNGSAASRPLARARRVLDQLPARRGPPPPKLRDAPDPATWASEPWRGLDARNGTVRPSSSNAVSLRVQPQLVLTLREALARAPGIKLAFVYGSAAQAQDGAQSDIDLMVIGDGVTFADCFAGLLNAEGLLKRRIDAKFVGAQEWRRKRTRGSAFVSRVNAQARLFIFASADDLRL